VNIFAIEYGADGTVDWRRSAKSQDNYRVVKMILESCQMLCTVLNEQHDEQVAPYRSTHKHHPSTRWAAASAANFMNLVDHCDAMLDEYTERFGKTHKCAAVLRACIELYDASRFPSQEPTRLPLAMPHHFHTDDTVLSYRKFYASKPRIRYPKNKIPEWFDQYRTSPYEVI
tara:strand:+ start:119 stop:634 length:516 start_codon:yes stop_codon:yes gene_type:complete